MPALAGQVCYALDVSQYAIGANTDENFYHAINKALQKREAQLLLQLSGCVPQKAHMIRYTRTRHSHPSHLLATASKNPTLIRYLHFLLSALNALPKESEDNFYRGVGPDAVKVRLQTTDTNTVTVVFCE